MKNLITIIFLMCCGCQYHLDRSEITLSGKYVVSRLELTNVSNTWDTDSLYLIGTTFKSGGVLPHPFDSIRMNHFYIHLNYSTIKMNLLGTNQYGQDVWEYGNPPDEIFYSVLGNNAYFGGYIKFSYLTKDNNFRTLVFSIEDDGYEHLILRSSGHWIMNGSNQKQVITLYLSRVGP